MNRLVLVVALGVLLLSGGVGAQAGGVVREVGLEHFRPVVFQEEDLEGGCGAGADGTEAGGGAFDREDGGRTIRFFERPPAEDRPGALADLYGDGYGSTGCGEATFHVTIPNGTDTVQVRFTGDRQIDGFDANVGAELIQTVGLRYPAGDNATHEAFAPDAGSADLRTIVIPPFTAHHEGPAEVAWYFEDRGFSGLGQGGPNPISGQDFSATVTDAVVSFSTTRTDLHTASVRDSREGTQLTKEHRVDVDLPASGEGGFSALYVKVAPGLDLGRVVAPDGTDLGPAQTYDGEGVLGQDQTHVVLELEEGGVLAMVPAPLTAAHGPGTYRFVFVERSGIDVSPALQPMSLILLATPLPFAVLAWMEARAFRKEAFGGFARSARNLQGGVALVSLYYGAVLLSAALGGRLALMAVWPMPLEGLLLYVQVGLAVVAFTALWLVAREMFRMVWPRERALPAEATETD